MSYEIDRVLGEIQKAGGRIRSRDLIDALQRAGLSRRDIQLAVQTALDKGVVKLDREMMLIKVTGEMHVAA